jgi:Gluconate 2-dehydrogenase subunit 3
MLPKPLMHLPPPGGSSRRTFLRRGLFGGALLSLGGAGLLAARQGTPVALPPEGLLVLGPREYAVVHAIARHALPDRAGFPSADEARVAFHVDRVLARALPDVADEVKQLLGLFDNALASFLFGGRTQAFTALPHAEQAEVLEGWRTSRLVLRRTGFQALRTLVHAAYYGNPVTWTAVGYPGPRVAHQPEAPVWKGGGKRPADNGAFLEDTSLDDTLLGDGAAHGGAR